MTDSGGVTQWDEPIDLRCPDCTGSGHNLRGYLPEIEWPASVVRWAIDAEVARGRNNQRQSSLVVRVLDDAHRSGWALPTDTPTRVDPRGEHRSIGMQNAAGTLTGGHR